MRPALAGAGPPAQPALGAGQGAFLRGSRPVGRLLQAGSLLAAAHHLLDTLQRAAHMRGQQAGQQADRLAAPHAQETPHLRSRRTLARIRPVGPQPAAARRTPRTRRRSCQIPGPLANIFLVGEIGLENDLHGCTGHGPASCCRAGHLQHGREEPLAPRGPCPRPLLPYRNSRNLTDLQSFQRQNNLAKNPGFRPK